MPTSSCRLVFALATANCDALTACALLRVRAAYGDARILLLSDNSDDPRFDALAQEVDAELIRADALYAQAAGGYHWRLVFERATAGPCNILFKIDPDTWVRRPFHHLPDPSESQLFGTPVVDPLFIDRPHMQGGCIGITRAAVDVMAASGHLEDDGYTRADYTAVVNVQPQHVEARRVTGRLSTDLILADVAYRVGVPMVRHDEVHSLWLPPEEEKAWYARGIAEPINSPGDAFAVTHPHKK